MLLQLSTASVANGPSSKCVAAHMSVETLATRTVAARMENPAMLLRQPGKRLFQDRPTDFEKQMSE